MTRKVNLTICDFEPTTVKIKQKVMKVSITQALKPVVVTGVDLRDAFYTNSTCVIEYGLSASPKEMLNNFPVKQ